MRAETDPSAGSGRSACLGCYLSVLAWSCLGGLHGGAEFAAVIDLLQGASSMKSASQPKPGTSRRICPVHAAPVWMILQQAGLPWMLLICLGMVLPRGAAWWSRICSCDRFAAGCFKHEVSIPAETWHLQKDLPCTCCSSLDDTSAGGQHGPTAVGLCPNSHAPRWYLGLWSLDSVLAVDTRSKGYSGCSKGSICAHQGCWHDVAAWRNSLLCPVCHHPLSLTLLPHLSGDGPGHHRVLCSARRLVCHQPAAQDCHYRLQTQQAQRCYGEAGTATRCKGLR